MRRRSERKKSTDVPSSPAQPQRRSTRRRKSPSFSETEKSDEKDVIPSATSEAEQESTHRESSEERSENRRSRGGRNRATPVKESPAKRKSKREASPVAQKIEVIPEEENGSLTEKVDLDEDAKLETLQNQQQEQVKTKDDEDEEQNVNVEEKREGGEALVPLESEKQDVEETAGTPQSTEESTLDATPLVSNLNDDVHDSVERTNIEVSEQSVHEAAADEETEDEVSKRDVVMVDESNDTMMIAETQREQSSPPPIPTAGPIAEQQHGENTGDDTNDGANEVVQKRRQSEKDEESNIISVSRKEEPSRNDRHHLSRDNMQNTSNNNNKNERNEKNDDNGRTRKRKWLTKKCTESQTPVLAISTKSLKNLIADVHPVPLSDVQLESSSEIEEVASEREEGEESPSPEHTRRRTSSDVQERDRDRSILKRSISKSIDQTAAVTAATTATASGGGIDNVQRSPSPALNKASNVLYITNLVRPFTVLQLKGLLARTGKIVEDGFWIDRIKSKCYVEYENEDEAIETRHALHGVRWPVSNPKCLNVEFGAKADMESAIESMKVDTPKFNIENNKDNIVVGSGWSRERVENDLKRGITKPVREWDVGKKESHLDRPDRIKDEIRHSRERDVSENRENHKNEKDKTNRSKGRDMRSSTLSPVRKVKKKENEPPLRLLDDLFRKTKTSPCIYWLPLTPEQIAEKEAFRQKRIEEHKQRLKQKELERGKEREREKERPRGNERDRERDRERDTRDREHRRNRSSDRRRSRSRDRRRY